MGHAGLSQIAWPNAGGVMPWTVLLFAAGEPDTPAPPLHCFTHPPPPRPPTWPGFCSGTETSAGLPSPGTRGG